MLRRVSPILHIPELKMCCCTVLHSAGLYAILSRNRGKRRRVCSPTSRINLRVVNRRYFTQRDCLTFRLSSRQEETSMCNTDMQQCATTTCNIPEGVVRVYFTQRDSLQTAGTQRDTFSSFWTKRDTFSSFWTKRDTSSLTGITTGHI